MTLEHFAHATVWILPTICCVLSVVLVYLLGRIDESIEELKRLVDSWRVE